MRFDFSEEQGMFRDAVAAFAQRHLANDALERAHTDDYPWEIARLMAEQGLLGITIPEDKGGMGGSLMDAVIAIETDRRGVSAFGRRCAGRQFRRHPNFRPICERATASGVSGADCSLAMA